VRASEKDGSTPHCPQASRHATHRCLPGSRRGRQRRPLGRQPRAQVTCACRARPAPHLWRLPTAMASPQQATHAQQEPCRPRWTSSHRVHVAASRQGGPRDTCHRAWLPADTTRVGPLPRRVGPTLSRRATELPHACAHRGDNASLSRMRHRARNRADNSCHTSKRSVHTPSVLHTPLRFFGLIFIATHRSPEIMEATASTLFATIIQTRHWARERMEKSLYHSYSGLGPPARPLCIWLGGVPCADNRFATPNDDRPLS